MEHISFPPPRTTASANPQVQTYDGRRCRALAFVSNPLFKLPAEVTPTEGYLSRVREGAADNYLDPAYQVRRLKDARAAA